MTAGDGSWEGVVEQIRKDERDRILQLLQEKLHQSIDEQEFDVSKGIRDVMRMIDGSEGELGLGGS